MKEEEEEENITHLNSKGSNILFERIYKVHLHYFYGRAYAMQNEKRLMFFVIANTKFHPHKMIIFWKFSDIWSDTIYDQSFTITKIKCKRQVENDDKHCVFVEQKKNINFL